MADYVNYWALAIPAGLIAGAIIGIYVRVKRPDLAKPVALVVFGMVLVILVQQLVRMLSG